MIKIFFGLPGCGKTTLMTKFALKFTKGKHYNNVYGNVQLAVPGYTYISNDCIGKYELVDGVILIDEGVVFACNRNYKFFDKHMTDFFMQHRHDRVDIYIFTQSPDLLDKQIRTIADQVFYMYKPLFLRKYITKYYRIPYDIMIPKRDDTGSQRLGEIILGYCQPNFFQKLFTSATIFRPLYYKYFDSWERKPRPPLPKIYSPYKPCSK